MNGERKPPYFVHHAVLLHEVQIHFAWAHPLSHVTLCHPSFCAAAFANMVDGANNRRLYKTKFLAMNRIVPHK